MAEEKGGGGDSSIGSDFFFYIGIILLFFIIWVAGGGPSRSISFEGPYLRPITNTGQSAEAYGNPNTNARFSTGISIGGWGGNVSTGARSTGSPSRSSDIGIAFKNETSAAKETDEDEEHVVITLSSRADAPISLAGWTLASETSGRSVMIPQGTELLQSGRVNQLAPVTLSPGESALIVTGRSPVGVSFRENMCVGYLEERQNFHPSLARHCPTPFQEYDDFYDDESDECLKYVRSLSYCTAPTRVPSEVPSSCERFVEEHLNYNGCVAAHRSDEAFSESKWRLYLGQSDELWGAKGETILLRDAAGNTIDTLSY